MGQEIIVAVHSVNERRSERSERVVWFADSESQQQR